MNYIDLVSRASAQCSSKMGKTDGEDQRPELQQNVQLLLGRCLLRIQQYEVLLKAILANHELVGPVDTLSAQQAARADKLARKSMGFLVEALFETYVVPNGFERELLNGDKAPTDRISVAMAFRMEMVAEDRERTKAAIEELVELRNQLIHHLIERFELWTDTGCIDAARHLEESYSRIDQHFLQLTEWAKSLEGARAMAAQVAQSPAFQDMVLNGVTPDGSFDWLDAGIVRVLREAAKEVATGGWSRLELARAWIADTHPEQVPERYGCRTWKQVLHESGQFELQYRVETGRRVAWYRELGEQL